MRAAPPALSLLLSVSCAAHAAGGDRLAQAALKRLDRGGPLVRNDCSGFVSTVLADVGIERRGGTRHFWKRARREDRVREGSPRPGDLAFFDRTYDANRNGRVDDELTHLALVVGVEPDGRIRMVHRGGRKISVLWVTPGRPGVHRAEGKVLNSFLRAPGYGPKEGPRLTGQLLRGFARPPEGRRQARR